MSEKVETIFVKSALPNNDVALWEKHPHHPGQEIFVAGSAEVEAAKTARVMRALADGKLVEVEKKTAASKK
ncbi:MAG: hypothetical protein WAS33_29750 [Candidatus Promineifilaceae bacterium]